MIKNNNKKILFLNPPYKTAVMRDYYDLVFQNDRFYMWHPIDFVIQSSFFREGYEVYLLDCIAEKKNHKRAIDDIKTIKPDVVISTSSGITLNEDMFIFEKIKNLFKSTIIFVTGDVFKYYQKDLLTKYPIIDGIILEFIYPGVKNYIEGKDGLFGILTKDSEGKNEHSFVYYHPPPMHEKFLSKKYYMPYWRGIYASVLTSHGCPKKCIFCPYPAMNVGIKLRDIENVAEEMEYIAKLGISYVHFRDLSFNVSENRVIQFCDMLLKKNIKLTWSAWMKPTPFTKEMAEAMKASGCYLIHTGVESGNPELVRKSGKGVTIDDIHNIIDLCNRYKIKISGHFVFGLPFETDSSLQETVEFILRKNFDWVNINIFDDSRPGLKNSLKLVPAYLASMRRKALIRFYSKNILKVISDIGMKRTINMVFKFILSQLSGIYIPSKYNSKGFEIVQEQAK